MQLNFTYRVGMLNIDSFEAWSFVVFSPEGLVIALSPYYKSKEEAEAGIGYFAAAFNSPLVTLSNPEPAKSGPTQRGHLRLVTDEDEG